MGLRKEQSETAKFDYRLYESLRQMRQSEGEYVVIEMVDVDHYNRLNLLSENGYVEKHGLQYKITESGLELLSVVEDYLTGKKIEVTESLSIDLEDVDCYLTEEEERRNKQIAVRYMKANLAEGSISEETEYFDLNEEDGIPVVKVTSENYAKLLDRKPGQHWKNYVGEAAKKLIREKKLSKIYVMNEDTGRQYLYIVPKK